MEKFDGVESQLQVLPSYLTQDNKKKTDLPSI